MDERHFTRKEKRKYEKAYELDNKIHGVAVSELTEDDIKDLKHTYGETEEILRRRSAFMFINRIMIRRRKKHRN